MENQICDVADVNGDGHDDLVGFSRGAPGFVWVGLSRGDGTFASGQLWASGFCLHDEICKLGDVNGDGRADLLAFVRSSNPNTGNVWVALATGTGFGQPIWAHDWFCLNDEICDVADVNGDGRDDLVGFSRGAPGFVWVGLSHGDGTFAGGQLWASGFCRNGEICKLGDVNGDGRADLLAFVRSSDPNTGNVWVALATGTGFGQFIWAHDWFCIDDQICDVADANGDGRDDLIGFSRGAPGFVWVGLSRGNGTFADGQLWTSGFCVENEICRTADVNGDGREDILAFHRMNTPG